MPRERPPVGARTAHARGAPASAAMLMLATLLATACGGPESRPASERPAATASSSGASPGTAAAPAGARPPCERTGHWIPCQVRERLQRAGLVLRDTTIDDLPKTGVSPAVFRLGRGGIAIYLFADSAARRRAAAALDTVKFVPASQPLTMLTTATLIENDNLLALLYSRNDQQRERVSDALLAGPPQP
ncbi:MAG TPA: hypothetical protein VL328_11785 [Gemmatimonadaceae bacterium]|nr:hypothetical protein [Gemmatimonadaceae bacterium]